MLQAVYVLHIESLNYCTIGLWPLRKAETFTLGFQVELTSFSLHLLLLSAKRIFFSNGSNVWG
jgi:hypothetical protein